MSCKILFGKCVLTRRMRAREVAEAEQAAKQAEREKEAASRTCPQARAARAGLEAEVQRLGMALSDAQQGQRYATLLSPLASKQHRCAFVQSDLHRI